MKVLIVEDEENSRIALKNLISNFADGIESVLVAEGVNSAIELILKQKPDILILDIELSDGTSFSILEKIPKYNFAVFFITAYNQYAQKAIKHSALDYILKPYDPIDVMKALEKAKTEVEQGSLQDRIKLLFENQNQIAKIALPSNNGMVIKPVEDILFLESSNNYTLFYFKSDDQILVTKTLKYYEDVLDKESFIRIHQSYLININYIEEYSRGEGASVIIGKKSIPVSRRKREELQSIISDRFLS